MFETGLVYMANSKTAKVMNVLRPCLKSKEKKENKTKNQMDILEVNRTRRGVQASTFSAKLLWKERLRWQEKRVT